MQEHVPFELNFKIKEIQLHDGKTPLYSPRPTYIFVTEILVLNIKVENRIYTISVAHKKNRIVIFAIKCNFHFSVKRAPP